MVHFYYIDDQQEDIIKFLKIFHRKFNIYKLNSIYFYFSYFLYYISNNSINFNNIYKKNINKICQLKIYYIFYLTNGLKNIDEDKDITIKQFLMNLNDEYHLNLLKFKSYYFNKNFDLNILSSFKYKLMLNLWHFMLYGKYYVYIVTYLYNLYLNTKCYLNRYPLVNIVLRFLLRSRLEKLIYFKKYKYSKYKFIQKFQIYDIKFKVNPNKSFLSSINIKNILCKLNIFKVLNLLSNKNIYRNFKFIWNNYIKINFLYMIFYINIHNDYDNSLACEYNKFNILGVFSFYWQLRRYGFHVDYYFYYFNIMYSKFFNINDYNCYFYKYLIFINNKYTCLFWYKINKIIILNYIRRSFYKYIKINRIILRNKFRRRLLIRKWLFFSNIYNMKFYPLKLIIYNKDKIKYFILSLLKQMNYLFNLNLFNYIYKYYTRFSINWINIIYNININLKINNDIYFFKNYIINLLKNKLKKYYYINLLMLLNLIKTWSINIAGKINYCVTNNRNDKDLTFYYKKLDLYHFYYLKGSYKFMDLYLLKIDRYLWYFEKSIMFNMYVKYMYHWYLFFFSVFSCYIIDNINVFNNIKIDKKKFIIRIRFLNKNNYIKNNLNKYKYI